jgi:VTC domain
MGDEDSARVERAIGTLAPVTLEALDERARLRRRVDTKYVVPAARAETLIEGLADRYEALEIDGHRCFTYESVYFDTRDLRCFHDHVEGHRPRFKVRTRYYRETGACFLEVKVKTAGDETVKRQCSYDKNDHGALTDSGQSFVEQTLSEDAGEAPPADLAPTLSTNYRRLTLGARAGGERATVDLAISLRSMDDRETRLRPGLLVIETKTEDGRSDIDDELQAAGCDPMSISKYRVGVGVLLAEDPEAASGEPRRRCFV